MRVDTLLHQIDGTVILRLRIGDLARCRQFLGLGLPVGGTQLLDTEPRVGDSGIGLRESDLVGFGVDGEQHVAFLHRLVVGNVHFDDAAGDIGRDRKRRLLQVGVFSLFVATTGHPVIPAGSHQDQRHRNHQQQAQAAGFLLLRHRQRLHRRRRCYGRLGSRRRLFHLELGSIFLIDLGHGVHWGALSKVLASVPSATSWEDVMLLFRFSMTLSSPCMMIFWSAFDMPAKASSVTSPTKLFT